MSWATLELNSGTISIETNDEEDGGTYYLVLNVDTNGESTATPVDVIYQVTINVCNRAYIVVINEIEDVIYSTQ